MAIVFNATTTKVEHVTAGGLDAAQYSVLVWIYLTGFGEGGTGRILGLPENGATVALNTEAGNSRLAFTQAFSTTGGVWRSPINSLATGRWFCVAFTYDRGSDTNDPLIYIRDTNADKNLVSVTVTESTAPVGSASSPATGYCVGNNTAQSRTFDGRMAYLQFWNRVLTLGELNTAMHFPGRITNGLKLFLPLIKDGVDWSGAVQNGTETDTAIGDGPPCSAPFQGLFGWFGAHTAAANVSVTPAPATCVAGKVDPTVVLGALSLAPNAAAAVSSTVNPTVIQGSLSLIPNPVFSVAAVVDPAVILGAVSVTPTPVFGVAAVVAPTVILGAVNVGPPPASAIVTTVDPTVVLGSLSLTPSAATAVVTVVDPSIPSGNISVSPAAATSIVIAVDPTTILGALSIAPQAVAAIGAVVAPTVLLGALSLTPGAVSAVTTTVDPALILGSLSLTPGPATVVPAGVNPSVVLGSLVITPTALAALGSVISPTVVLGSLSVQPGAATVIVMVANPVVDDGQVPPTVVGPTRAVVSGGGRSSVSIGGGRTIVIIENNPTEAEI